MKRAVVFTSLFALTIPMSLFAHTHGNGGTAWVCWTDSSFTEISRAEQTDLWELRERGGNLRTFEGDDYRAIVAEALERIAEANPFFEMELRGHIDHVLENIDIGNSRLSEIEDAVYIRTPDNGLFCPNGSMREDGDIPDQVANYTEAGDVLIYRRIWDHDTFGKIGRAALIVHEGIYALFRSMRNPVSDSNSTRRLVGEVFSDISADELADAIGDAYNPRTYRVQPSYIAEFDGVIAARKLSNSQYILSIAGGGFEIRQDDRVLMRSPRSYYLNKQGASNFVVWDNNHFYQAGRRPSVAGLTSIVRSNGRLSIRDRQIAGLSKIYDLAKFGNAEEGFLLAVAREQNRQVLTKISLRGNRTRTLRLANESTLGVREFAVIGDEANNQIILVGPDADQSECLEISYLDPGDLSKRGRSLLCDDRSILDARTLYLSADGDLLIGGQDISSSYSPFVFLARLDDKGETIFYRKRWMEGSYGAAIAEDESSGLIALTSHNGSIGTAVSLWSKDGNFLANYGPTRTATFVDGFFRSGDTLVFESFGWLGLASDPQFGMQTTIEIPYY